MQEHRINWYIDYDNETFEILNTAQFAKKIVEVAKNYANAPVFQPDEEDECSEWIEAIADAVSQISLLLYNFFYVEEKLTNHQDAKELYCTSYTVLRVEKLYSSFFLMFSENFRTNRILACCLRLNRFIQQISQNISNIQKNLDQTFLDNLKQIYTFIEQKIKETLIKTKNLEGHDLNIILIDTLSLLLRISGDPTMDKILDKNKEKSIMQSIEKSNLTYEEFEILKAKEKENFNNNYYFSIEDSFQEDPNNKKISHQDSGEDD